MHPLFLRRHLDYVLATLCFFTLNNVYASLPLQSEIQHLMDYVAQSGCVYIRNDEAHSAAEAVEHIQKKYDYFKSRVDSAEDFIAWSASKSLISRRPYYIQCSEQDKVPSQQWLLEELHRFRQQQSASGK